VAQTSEVFEPGFGAGEAEEWTWALGHEFFCFKELGFVLKEKSGKINGLLNQGLKAGRLSPHG
jgi:hypothetical protein